MRWPTIITRLATRARARPRVTGSVVAAAALVVAVLGWRLLRAPPRESAPVTSPTPVLVGGPAPRPERVVTFAEGCATASCHAPPARAVAVHAPDAAGACSACHAPDAGGHTYPLIRRPDQLCASCHTTSTGSLHHPAALGGDACLACHDPHASGAPGLLRGPSVGATCARCHVETPGAVKHAPYGADRCDACHDPHGAAPEPTSVVEQCRACHPALVDAVERRAHTHRDVKGSCLACHTPHASDHKGLLRASVRESCTGCHPGVGAAVANAVVSHDPVLKDHQCVTCHEPHGSENPRMLRDAEGTVCLSCHDKPVKGADGRTVAAMAPALASAAVVHGAVRLGDCGACHSVHGGDHARLLRVADPQGLTGPFDVKNYAMCFSCHDARLAGAGGGTLFRDGERNLHEAHLRSGEKSRGCASCHAIHAGDLPRLIAKAVNFEGSGWEMPLNFTLTESGGRCGPGCHEALEYSRRPGGARSQKTGGAP